MSEKFNLKWNDFQTNVSKSFRLFRNESYLHDVTLVSDDYKHIPAHKLVLSASSEYFRNILQQTKQSQPILCLESVNAADLQNVLDYVYDGEVKIHQEDLDRFLNVAQRLKLEGLISNKAVDDNLEKTLKEEEENTIHQEETPPTFPKTGVKPVHNVQKQRKPVSNQTNRNVVALQNGGEMSEEDHKQRLADNVTVNQDGTATCKICNRVFGGRNAKQNSRIHVETHIEGLSYSCEH